MNTLLQKPPIARRADTILGVAARILNARGVSDEWFADIAAELKISRPALYSHFRDRDDLLFACYMQAIETLETTFVGVAGAGGDEGALLEAFLDATIADDFPELAVVAEIDVLPEPRRSVVRERWSRLIGRLAALVETGTRHGRLRPIDPLVVSNSALGLATWAPLQRRLLPGRHVDAVRSGTKEFFLRGLASDRSVDLRSVVVNRSSARDTIDLFDKASLAHAKREQLLGAASSLFNRRGIGATRIEEIADAMGVNKRAIFRLFGSKDQLVTACFERASLMNQSVAIEAAALPATRVEALHSGIRNVVLILGDPSRPSLTSHVGLGRLTPGDQVNMRSRFAGLEQAYRNMIDAGIAEGSIRHLRVDDVVAALAGNLNWVASADLPTLAIPLEEIAVQLADIAVTGILV